MESFMNAIKALTSWGGEAQQILFVLMIGE